MELFSFTCFHARIFVHSEVLLPGDVFTVDDFWVVSGVPVVGSSAVIIRNGQWKYHNHKTAETLITNPKHRCRKVLNIKGGGGGGQGSEYWGMGKGVQSFRWL